MQKNNIYETYKKISKLTIEQIFEKLGTGKNGLSEAKANSIYKENGPNLYIKDNKKSWFYFFVMSFKDPFILVLLGLAVINYMLGDHLGSYIIVAIACISAIIRFVQDYQEYLFNRKLKSKIYSTANVLRGGVEKNVKESKVVVGDVVVLNAGSIIPGDVYLIDAKDLFVNESIFTGESTPVEKTVAANNSSNIFDISNICLMESSVISGSGIGVIINTGTQTYIGSMGKELSKDHIETSFDVGMKSITKLLLAYMLGTVLFVLIVDGVVKQNVEEAIMFALSVAVGITPSMLPMIVNVNLAKGSKSLANKKVLVKRMEAIQNLGSMDILCTDKTGTLTENNIVLQKYINVNGDEDLSVLKYAYLNSYFSTGVKNIIDKAIMSYAQKNKVDTLSKGYKKIDEIPFDYSRKKMSVVVKNHAGAKMITKGAVEVILESCNSVKYKEKIYYLTKTMKEKVLKKSLELENEGMQVIGLAEKNDVLSRKSFGVNDEKDMVFVGFVGFFDPPKKDVKNVIKKLRDYSVEIKILTGDSEAAVRTVCAAVGIDENKIINGSKLDKFSDKKLSEIVEKYDVYARLDPLQKERVIQALKVNGHVVGYMGDGVNDAPSLHIADVGISVNKATDIAKESGDLILLEKSLNVIFDGVVEGRKTYANIIKFMKMALSDDFGDVFSILIASTFLPFLPLLPIQMLIQDFIYDFSQIGIPYDNVDEEYLLKPKKWDTKDISRFMFIMGIVSSTIDVAAFAIFWFILGYNNNGMASYFQTAWFVLCLLTELLVIHNVRTAKRPFIESRASKPLTLLSILSMALTILIPILLSPINTFGFVILPPRYYLWAGILLIAYILIVSIIKKIYIKKYGKWL